MTTTLQQMIAEPEPLLARAQRGEEIVLTEGGKPVVRLTGIATGPRKAPPGAIAALVKEAEAMAAASATGTATTNGVGEVARPTPAGLGPRKASPEALRNWMQKAAAAAAAGTTGKRGMTVDEIIDDLRSERF